MTERDEEGRPVATQNAGAFMAPYSGVPPVPSAFIDQRGASVEHVSEAEAERHGQRETVPASARHKRLANAGWLLAISTSLAVWTLCYSVVHLVRDATAWVVDQQATTAGMNLLSLLHAEGVGIAASAVFLAIGIRIGTTYLPSRGVRALLLLTAATLLGALILGFAVVDLGAGAAVVTVACALACLAAAYQLRPL